MISVQKWLFWPRLSFDPLNGTGNTNKPLETHGHMPIPYPGQREHQIWAFQRVFRSWVDLNQGEKWGKKSSFCFFSFSTHYMASKPNTKVCHTKILFRCQKKFHLESLRPDFGTEKGQIWPLKLPEKSKNIAKYLKTLWKAQIRYSLGPG